MDTFIVYQPSTLPRSRELLEIKVRAHAAFVGHSRRRKSSLRGKQKEGHAAGKPKPRPCAIYDGDSHCSCPCEGCQSSKKAVSNERISSDSPRSKEQPAVRQDILMAALLKTLLSVNEQSHFDDSFNAATMKLQVLTQCASSVHPFAGHIVR
jgi:hypothetical protein